MAVTFLRLDDFEENPLPGCMRSMGIVSDRRIGGCLKSGEGWWVAERAGSLLGVAGSLLDDELKKALRPLGSDEAPGRLDLRPVGESTIPISGDRLSFFDDLIGLGCRLPCARRGGGRFSELTGGGGLVLEASRLEVALLRPDRRAGSISTASRDLLICS